MRQPGFRQLWPCLAAIGVYWVLVIALVSTAKAANDGHWVYPLDDTYIHMAIAKNAAVSGVWGLTADGFTSSTSSPLWTALLALTYAVAGVSDVAPLLLNVLFGTLMLVAVHITMRLCDAGARWTLVTLVAVTMVTPLGLLTLSGMEHLAHALISLAVLALASAAMSNPAGPAWISAGVVLLTPFLTMARYEGLFQVAGIGALLFMRGRRTLAIMMGVAGVTLIAAYGWWSAEQGWMWLPNSVLLKGSRPAATLNGVAVFLGTAVWKAIVPGYGLELLMFVASLSLFWLLKDVRNRRTEAVGYANALLAFMILCHLLFASVDKFYRYEAYLIFLSIVVTSASLITLHRYSLLPAVAPGRSELMNVFAVVVFVGLVASAGARGWRGIPDAVRASQNIYGQQYQMARFVRAFFPSDTVALNDVGAVAYLSDARIMDLWGLGSLEPARLKLEKLYGTDAIRRLAGEAGVNVALVYDSWFVRYGGLPPEWTQVARWTIPDNIVCGDDTVSIYAVSSTARADLVDHIREFSKSLPEGVVFEGMEEP